MIEMEKLKTLLYGNPETAISDIKFFPIENSNASIEEIAKSVRNAIESVRAGGGCEIDLSI